MALYGMYNNDIKQKEEEAFMNTFMSDYNPNILFNLL